MQIVVNGLEEDVEPGVTITELIERFQERDKDLIVELNHRFVYPRDYGGVRLEEGDVLEFIHPAFGG